MKTSRVYAIAVGVALISCAGERRSSQRSEVSVQSSEGSRLNLLTEKKNLPASADVFCQGIRKVLARATQNLKAEADVLCADQVATDLLTGLIAQPYTGSGTPTVRKLARAASPGTVANFLAYAIRVKKKPVPTILAEENLVKSTNYAGPDGFTLALSFDTVPPENAGDCDTAFKVVQRTVTRNSNVNFDDTSKHDLKLYLMHQDNFDYLMAGRTLVQVTDQIKYSRVLRGVMPDPKDPEYSISVSVVNLVMNDRNQAERAGDAFDAFIVSDIQSTYNYHANN